jgi:Ser/Thr protein kinase RdoA (MazF antagonist)
VFHFGGFRYAVYPRRGGRAPELEDFDTLVWLGRLLGRIHAVGATGAFEMRGIIDVASFGDEPSTWLLHSGIIPPELREQYRVAVAGALDAIRLAFSAVGYTSLRVHGDCHGGNVLWTDAGPHFVDFDDCRMGPSVQDLWMLLSGSRAEMIVQLSAVLDGYEQFRAFDRRELTLIEPLRCLRLIHYAAWIARRWDDPAFPLAFPWFTSSQYWHDRILELRDQIVAMQEPPLAA